ncbi:MAG: pyridoxamine 5'-phosphate oxidase family protein [Deltaproteobacteria bacterium]|nr:pyridoxamine 5'-phosphate oxidase family protein [Deltaproteobacteria bacterium]
MRKQEREIRGDAEIREILQAAPVCRIGLADAGAPYVVPMNFGLGDGCLYLHCASEGRKLEILRSNNRVCFEMDILREVRAGETPCGWTADYRSVIGFGRAIFVADPQEKRVGLDSIMKHYRARGPFAYPEEILAKTVVIRIDIESISGKHHE